MTTGEEWIDLLDRLEKGMLTAAEKLALEQKLSADKSFQRFAEEHGKLLSALKSYGTRRDLYALLDDAHKEVEVEEPRSPVKHSSLRYWYLGGIAASVLIIIAATIVIIEQNSAVTYKELRLETSKTPKPQKAIPKKKSSHDSIISSNSNQVNEAAEVAPYGLTSEGDNRIHASAPPGKYRGSGCLISAKGFIVTSYHVIRDADSVYVHNEKFGRRKVAVLYKDIVKDVAILELLDKSSVPSRLPYLISDKEAELGEDVYTLGYPRQDIVFGEGSISAQSGFLQNPDAYQISVPVNPGNSGGPLFNAQGNLVGIISGLQTQTYGTAFATKSSTLRRLIDEWETPPYEKKITLPTRNTLKNLSRVQQVKQWKDFVFMVEVYN